ncbi:MAG: ATP-binding protein [Bacteroidales bacterium]|nr:ATP-binding protein [Bacteroidales bacterium]
MATISIIGRKSEQAQLDAIVASGRPEFVVVYGRRRVGKTFLVNNYFKGKFAFKYTGIAKKNNALQLQRFGEELRRYGLSKASMPNSWFEAFDYLRELLEKKLKGKSRQVVFIDELPFMDSQRSNLVPALENFWNSWGCTQPNLLLILCGSATTWITHKIIKNHGGLHNRLTAKLKLRPFTLAETKAHLRSLNIEFSQRDIMECYMIMGGIPFYQSLLKPGVSMAQNIDNLFFNPDGLLADEFENLYVSLFEESERYVKIVESLSLKAKGMTRKEIQDVLGIKSSGTLTSCLENLENCDLIRSFRGYGKTARQTMYQLMDFYTLFYFRFLRNRAASADGLWMHIQGNPRHNAWCGYAFEQLCLAHYPQIASALGIMGIHSEVFSWISDQKEGGAQIDLVIKRADRIVNVCEMKYWRDKFRLTQKYIDDLQNKIDVFRRENKLTQAVHLVMVTTCGLSNPSFSSLVQKELTAEDLFKEI